jgi:hypothetical protein
MSPLKFRAAVATLWLVAANVPGAFAKDKRTEAQAQVIDQAEFPCSDCFFGASKHFYCFAAGKDILLAYQKTPAINFMNSSKNYLEPARPAWAAWKPGAAAVPVTYDQKHIWLTRGDLRTASGFLAGLKGVAIWATRGQGKKVKLSRTSISDVFMNDNRCHVASSPVKAQ